MNNTTMKISSQAMRMVLIGLIGILAVPASVTAQACSTYYPIEEGVRLEYTMYNKKEKIEGTQWQEFREVVETADGLETKVFMGLLDEKGKETFSTSYGMSCNGNAIRIDFESLLSGPMLDQQEDMEAEITGTDIELPNRLEVGMELPDANVEMKLSMGPMKMTMEVNTTDRKVEKIESVQTPAGTFECYVISSNTQSKMMLTKNNFPSRIWLAKDVGMVQSENYNSKGKLMSRMVLSKISK